MCYFIDGQISQRIYHAFTLIFIKPYLFRKSAPTIDPETFAFKNIKGSSRSKLRLIFKSFLPNVLIVDPLAALLLIKNFSLFFLSNISSGRDGLSKSPLLAAAAMGATSFFVVGLFLTMVQDYSHFLD